MSACVASDALQRVGLGTKKEIVLFSSKTTQHFPTYRPENTQQSAGFLFSLSYQSENTTVSRLSFVFILSVRLLNLVCRSCSFFRHLFAYFFFAQLQYICIACLAVLQIRIESDPDL